eukprot:jgi/Tetstr1/442996/TSEL_031056.t1
MEHTRRHLGLVKRKHEVSEALEIAAVHLLSSSKAGQRVRLEGAPPRTFSHQWSANNAAKKIGGFLDAVAGRAEDDTEGARLQRHVAAKLTDRYQPPAPSGAPCYGPCYGSDGCGRRDSGALLAAVGQLSKVTLRMQ